MIIGDLRESVSWYRPNRIYDDLGGYTVDEVFMSHLWAAILKPTHKYGDINNQPTDKSTLTIRVRIPSVKILEDDIIRFNTSSYKGRKYIVNTITYIDHYDYADIILTEDKPVRR